VDKRTWINIGLLFAFIVLLSVLLLIPKKETEQDLPRLSTIDSNDIVQIEILRKDLDNFIFNKQDETWHMNSPLRFRANNSRINALLRILKVESHGQFNPAEIDLERLDLDDPIIVMKLNDHEFSFGNTDAIDQRRYVLFDNTIHMVNDFLYHQLKTDATFFADTKLLPEKLEIKSIQFPGYKIDWIDDYWHINSLLDISPDQLKRLVFDWQKATAISVSIYAAPESESLIKLTTSSNESIIFVIVAIEPHLILGRKDIGIQYHMGSDESEKLLLKENSSTENQTNTAEVE